MFGKFFSRRGLKKYDKNERCKIQSVYIYNSQILLKSISISALPLGACRNAPKNAESDDCVKHLLYLFFVCVFFRLNPDYRWSRLLTPGLSALYCILNFSCCFFKIMFFFQALLNYKRSTFKIRATTRKL